MRIYDLTLPLRNGMPIYPGDPPFKRDVQWLTSKSGQSEVSRITMGSHTGTHVDAPAHMLRCGIRVDKFPNTIFIGPARVIDLRGIKGRHIEVPNLERHNLRGVNRLLIRTRNSGRWGRAKKFDPGFIALTGEAAGFLVKKGLRLVGIDGPSVDVFRSGTHPAHIALMDAGVVIVEGLNLSGVPAGDYTIFCAPLKIKGGEGAPARVFLVK